MVVDKVNGGIVSAHQLANQYTYSNTTYPYGAFMSPNEDSIIMGFTTQNYAKTPSGLPTALYSGAYQAIILHDSLPFDLAPIGSGLLFVTPTASPGGSGAFTLGDNNSTRLNSARTDGTPITVTSNASFLSAGPIIVINPLSASILWGNV